METLGDYDCDRIKLLVTQRVEGDELEEGMKILRQLYAQAIKDQREDVPVSKLRIGLKCGGSDGFSGITANPLVGELSDWLVAQGGTSVLTEVGDVRCRDDTDEPLQKPRALRQDRQHDKQLQGIFPQSWRACRREPVARKQSRWHLDARR